MAPTVTITYCTQCNWLLRASWMASELLSTFGSDLGRVTLVPGARDDHDRYGRLLRYLDVNGVDLGLQQIRTGHAIARYDSREPSAKRVTTS